MTDSVFHSRLSQGYLNFVRGPVCLRRSFVTQPAVKDTMHDKQLARTKDYTIREATLEDRDIVLNIRKDFYSGLDYLPAFYDHFITLPNGKGFVVISGDQAIGFFLILIVDDGESFCMRGGRVRKDYEGKGVLRFTGSYLVELARSIGALHWSYTATDTSSKALKRSYQVENKLILTMDHLVFSLETENLHLREADKKQTTEVKPIPFDDVATYISSKETSKYLFPHGRILVDYTPYKLVKTNVLLMKQTSSNHTEAFSDVRIENGSVRGSLSFGSVFKTQTVSYVYNIEIYGNDPVSVKFHIMKHLIMLKQKVHGSVCFMLVTQEGFPVNIIDDTCREHGLSRVNHGQKHSKWQFRKESLFEFSN